MKLYLLKTMLLLCALVVGSMSGWADEITFTAGTDQGSNGSSSSSDSMTKNGITISGTYLATTTEEYRIYSGCKLSISSSVGTITKIVLTSTAKKGSKYGPDNISAKTGTYSTTQDSNIGTWTGSATSIEFSASAQCRASKIVVTYTPSAPSPTYTVALPDENDYGSYTMNATNPVSSGTEVELIYTPATGYENYVATWSVNGEAINGNKFTMPNENVTVTVSVNEVVNYVTLPFEWAGGASSALTAIAGVTANGLGSDYASSNAPYLVKLDGTGDYIQVKTDSQPGKVTIRVKMIGGASTSKISVQGSSDGETFTDVEELTISGAANAELTLKTTNAFAANVRYVRFLFTKGSNVGLGPITIAKPASPLSSISVDATEATTVFNQNDTFSSEGIVVTATYEDNSTEVVTGYSVSEPDMSTPGTKTVTVSFGGKEDSYEITVIKSTTFTWDLSKASYDEIEDPNIVTWSSSFATMTNSSENGGTSASNYLGGDSSNRTSSRFYSGNTLTITPVSGYQITSVEFTATTESYANALAVSTWENANAIASSGTTVTVTPTDGTAALVATIGGTCGFTSVKVTYSEVVPVTITSVGYATFWNAKATDFNSTDITVYTAKDGATSVTLNEITSRQVPANTPVVLYKAGGCEVNVPVIDEADDVDDNDLRISDGTNPNNAYVLANKNDIVGFYKWAGTSLSAGKVYLQSNSNNTRSFLPFSEATGISEVENSKSVNGKYYDLQGRRVVKAQKGLYIMDGKKVLVK